MKKLLIFFLAIVMCFGIISTTACSEKQTITIGYTEVDPLNYLDENGELVGFDTELAEKVFTELGYEVRFKLIVWQQKYIELNSGTVDCVWNGFTANCADDDGVQRSEKVDFSYNYMINAQCIVRAAAQPDLTDKSQFSGNSVAFEAGSAAQTYVEAVENVNTKECASQMDALREVMSGTSQYAVVDYLLAQSICGKGDFTNVVLNEGIEIDLEYYAIGFKKGSELTAKVNAKLVELAESGYIATLAEKYGVSTQAITDFSDQQ